MDDVEIAVTERAAEIVALDDALRRLADLDPRQAKVVECRYFAGLTETETAEALGISVRTVAREWLTAKGWLYRELQDDTGKIMEKAGARLAIIRIAPGARPGDGPLRFAQGDDRCAQRDSSGSRRSSRAATSAAVNSSSVGTPSMERGSGRATNTRSLRALW